MKKRSTIQRQIILDAVKCLDHPSAGEVYTYAHARFPQLSLGTVYRNLSSLCEDGTVIRLTVSGSPDRYDLPLVPHCHLRCSRCGRLIDIADECVPDLNRMMREKTGMELDSNQLVFTGLCGDCKKKKSAEEHHPHTPARESAEPQALSGP